MDAAYAATYPQLMNQALAAGRPPAELAALRRTYDLAERLCDGVYRAQSVPFVCHFVRAASIMLAERQPVEVVQVAMLHGAYRMCGFRDSRRRKPRASHRALIRRTLGEPVEQLLWAYDRLPWYSLGSVREHLATIDAADETTRRAVLVRLADYLDDHLDRAMAYAGRVYDDPDARAYRDACAQLAERLGCPALSRAIVAAYDENFTADVPDSLVMHRTRGYERPRHHLWEMTPIESAALNLARRAYRLLTRQRHRAAQTYGGACDDHAGATHPRGSQPSIR